MLNNNFIITLTGPSQSGKSLVMEKIEDIGKELEKKGLHFVPKKISKYTTRYLRLDEMKLIEKGEEVDVIYTEKIPDTCDLVYQTYGVKYGLETKVLENKIREGHSPIVVINDIRVVEEIKNFFSGKVLSLFLFRKIPELEDFKKEALQRGNVSEAEVIARYEKAIAIYRTYIENIILFDKVVLNTVEYIGGEEKSNNTIIYKQLLNILLPIIQGKKKLRTNIEYPKLSRIFVIAGNAASGKDEIIRALISMGKLQAKVLPKYASRQQEREDGDEMICQYIPRRSIITEFKYDFQNEAEKISKNLNKFDIELQNRYQKEFIHFKQKLEENNKDEYERFWEMIADKLKNCEDKKEINKYFEKNPQYIDLAQIKKSAVLMCEDHDICVFQENDKRYVIYGSDNRLYGIDITDIRHILEDSKSHLVIVASQIGLVNVLKREFDEKRVRLIYAHSDISAKEFEANASDIIKNEKKEEFREILDNYTQEISDYDHVTIYAKSQLTYEQTSKEEELIDQMFRLLRAY